MKQLLTVLFALLLTAGVNAQLVQLNENISLGTLEQGENFYFEGNEHTVGAGLQFLGLTAGVNHTQQFGDAGLYLDAQFTPTIVNAYGVKLIAGVGGAYGYQMKNKDTAGRFNGVVGIRYSFIELTTRWNSDYTLPVTVRLYLD